MQQEYQRQRFYILDMAACAIDCGDTVRLKACGGIGPYTWSKTGDVTLSSTHGIAVSVTTVQPAQVPGVFPGYQVFLTYQAVGAACSDGADSGGPGFEFQNATLPSTLRTYYDCDGNANSPTIGTGCNINACGCVWSDAEGDGPPNISCFCSLTPCCLDVTQGTIANGGNRGHHIRLQNDLLEGVYGSGQTHGCFAVGQSFSLIDTDLALQTPCITATSGPVGGITPKIDLRNNYMISLGCGPCALGAVTVTCTDSAGVSATTILHT